MTTDKVKYQIEKAISALREALKYGSEELNPYELGNITDAIKSLDSLNFTMKISDMVRKENESDPVFSEVEKRVSSGGFKWNNQASFVPANPVSE